MNQQEFQNEMKKTFDECLEIIKKKNADYSLQEDPFRNFRFSPFIKVPIERGMLVRIGDKISRISTLLDQKAKVKDEKLEDTILDLIGYAAILKVYLKQRALSSAR